MHQAMQANHQARTTQEGNQMTNRLDLLVWSVLGVCLIITIGTLVEWWRNR